MTHLAYNLATGEVLTTTNGNHLKRWVKRHTANDRNCPATAGCSPMEAVTPTALPN